MEEFFKALGDETRITIMRMLAQNGEMCVCNIVDGLKMGQSGVSHHLAKMKQAKLLIARKKGQWIYYSLNIAAIKEGPLTFLSEVADAAEKNADSALNGNCC